MFDILIIWYVGAAILSTPLLMDFYWGRVKSPLLMGVLFFLLPVNPIILGVSLALDVKCVIGSDRL